MSNFYLGDRVITPDGKGSIVECSGLWYTVKLEKQGEIKYYTESQMKRQ